MSDSAAPAVERPAGSARTVALFTLLHAALISALLLLFAWPAATAEPRDLPIGLVGPAPVAEQLIERLDEAQPGALDVAVFDSRAEAEEAIAAREIYGAVVADEQPEALVATAASPAVAQLLTDLTRSLSDARAAAAGVPTVPLQVTDIAPLTASDPRGAVFGSFALPLIIGGISLAAMAALRLSSIRARVTLIVIASVTTSLALAAILSGWLDVLPGSYGLNVLVISATFAAIAFAITGAHALFGFAGFGSMAALLFLLGNPLSGVALPPEFYLGAWGAVGQAMPVGAGYDLLRTVNFFDTADPTGSWTVLVIWIGVGAAALAIGALPRRRAMR